MDRKTKLTVNDMISVKESLSNFSAFDKKIKKEQKRKVTDLETIFDKKNNVSKYQKKKSKK